MKIKISHFGPTKGDSGFNDKTVVWVNTLSIDDYEDDPYYGYIPNFWKFDEINKQEIEVKTIKHVFMESSNGGRTNEKVYNSISEYLNCEIAKQHFQEYKKNRFAYSGNPDRVDGIITLQDNDGHEFQLENTYYGLTVPSEWYSESYKDIIKKLDEQEVFENKEDVIVNITDDLFGQRYFPVARFETDGHSKNADYVDNVLWYCKAHSLPLQGERGVYYGMRIKSFDSNDAIDEIYKHGKIIKGMEWDWE